ncbi:MAG: [citrate (pro-3S)-lyase] ligase [Spirochaetes bacterium]|nr:[citrate (pro-3S)-lyase] ligase [Spirochaetota bacterium]
MNFSVEELRLNDARGQRLFDKLLGEAGIKRDNNLDYIAGIYDADYNLAAAGACFGNTLRCLAVGDAFRGEGLMAPVVTHLVERLTNAGQHHIFLYTKCENADVFSALGFYEIARVQDEVLLMENLRRGFAGFLEDLNKEKREGEGCAAGSVAALVMNCNPFTLGHRHLIETAAGRADTLHIFAVAENLSLFPFADRFALIQKGCADLPNVRLHSTGSYMVSQAVFPSYFLRDEAEAIEAQARLDVAIFKRIAAAVGATTRFVGEEPFSVVTGIYNRIMGESLPAAGITCTVIPRKEFQGVPISASRVRKLLQAGDVQATKEMVPPTTFDYFDSPQGRQVIANIQKEREVEHY